LLRLVTRYCHGKPRQSAKLSVTIAYHVAAMIRIDTNAKDIAKQLDRIVTKQIPFAQSLIANRMAQKVKSNELSVMKSRLDRPTPFTLNSLRLKPGNKQKPEAKVFFKDFGIGQIDWHYLNPQVGGGDRKQKRSEKMFLRAGLIKSNQFLVPASSAKRDQFGNMQRGQLMQVLSALKLHYLSGYTANASGSKRSNRTQAKSGANRYFFGTINGETGVWQRERSGFGDAVRAIMIVKEGSPKYRIRFPFFAVAENTVSAHYARVAADAIEEVLKTAR